MVRHARPLRLHTFNSLWSGGDEETTNSIGLAPAQAAVHHSGFRADRQRATTTTISHDEVCSWRLLS